MNPKIAKLRAELEKNTERIARLQARNGELKQQIQELENLDIVSMSALLDDGNTVEVCGCIDRCYAGHVNTTCPICAKNMTECVGKEPETTEAPTTAPTEPVKEPEKKSNPAGLLLVLLILGMGGAVAWHFFKNKMPDQQTKGDTDLDDYDYGIDEDDDLDYDTEDEQEEQH